MDVMALHFIRPGWLLLLPLAILIPVLWRRLRRHFNTGALAPFTPSVRGLEPGL